MNRRREQFIAGLGVVSTAVILGLCLFVSAPYTLDRGLTLGLGFTLVVVGMALVLWAAFYIGKAFGGEIKPMLDYFVSQGPYRFLRHPVYLGLTSALVGVTLGFNNWLGTLAVFGLFLPNQVVRAGLEEKALAERFGISYEVYRRRTGFMLPKLNR